MVDQIKSKLVAARQPGIDRAKIQSEITELQSQLRGIADSASFSGENWLSVDFGDPGYNAVKTIVSSFSRSGGVGLDRHHHHRSRRTPSCSTPTTSRAFSTRQSTTTNGGVTYSVAGATDAVDISALTDSADDLADLEEIIGVVDGTMSPMTDAATALGASKARIGIQQDFVKSLMDAVTAASASWSMPT